MTHEQITYRDHTVQLSKHGPGWRAVVRAPGAVVIANLGTTDDLRGRDVMLEEARSIVDGRAAGASRLET